MPNLDAASVALDYMATAIKQIKVKMKGWSPVQYRIQTLNASWLNRPTIGRAVQLRGYQLNRFIARVMAIQTAKTVAAHSARFSNQLLQ